MHRDIFIEAAKLNVAGFVNFVSNNASMKRTVFVLLFLSVFAMTLAQQAQQLKFREETHDFGLVEENNGPVTHEFVFTNESPRPVKIVRVQASCGCTTPGWSKEVIAPGGEGYIQASYDPKGRPGFFSKSLTVTTDLGTETITLHIKGEVTNSEKPTAADYPVSMGNMRMKVGSFNMGRVYVKDESVVREFPFINGGESPLNFTGKFVHPPYINVDVDPRTVQPGARGVVRISYNGGLKNQYGFQSDNVEIETDDASDPVKSFSVYATLEDFFPEMTPAELARAPRLTFDSYTLDFGNIQGDAGTVREVLFTNTGRQELVLKSIQPNCSCITASVEKTSLKPGESSILKITFHPLDRLGTQNKAISFYSNDPKNPVQRLTFTAYVQ